MDPRLVERAERAQWPDFEVMEEYSKDEEDSKDDGESQSRAAEKEQEEEVEEELEKCAKEDVDIMDVRIEGMEAAMMEMNNLVQLMQKKVSAECRGCVHVSRIGTFPK